MDGAGAQNAHATGWNSTFPSSTLCFLGSGNGVNQSSSTYNEYLWGSVDGYSAFGGYEGNGAADGSFQYLGFGAKSIFAKNIDADVSWVTHSRSAFPNNVVSQTMFYDLTNTLASNNSCDIVSNGIKRRVADTGGNGAVTYVYGSWGGTPIQGNGTDTAQGRAR